MTKYKLLKKIDDPSDLKQLNMNALSDLSDEISHFIGTTIEEVGGHYSSPLGVVDLTVAMHYAYNSPFDKIIWDVGHQAYAHKIICGRKDRFNTIRTKNGISGFLKRSESEHDIFGAGHASTSISAALGMAHARDKKKEKNQVVAVIGDGAMTGGLAYEGINNLGYHKTQLTVVLNDNTMSISKSVGALSHYLTRVVTNPTYNKIRNDIWDISGKIPIISKHVRKILRKTEEGIKGYFTPGALFEEFGLRYIGPIDGHNMEELVRTFKAVKEMNTPVLVHVYTNKGKGSKLAESDSTKYYSMPGMKTQKANKLPDYSKVFGHAITQLADKNDKIVCITAAMEVGTGMSVYTEKYPERYIDVGIAEEHAITYASGLSAEGFVPVVAIYSTFMQRAYDHVFHDAILQKLPLVVCMDRAGLVGPDGPTHHGVFDIALFKHLPDVIISAPKDGQELKNLLYTATESKSIFLIRYPKSNCVNYNESESAELLEIGSWEYLQKGSKVAVLATGSMVDLALSSLEEINRQVSVNPTVVNARFIKPMDRKILDEVLTNHDTVITMEEGALIGGFGSSVLEYIHNHTYKCKVIRMGIPDEYIEHATRQELLDEVKLNTNHLIENIKKSI